MRPETERGVAAAIEVAREHGLDAIEGRVLSDRHGVLVHLAAAPVLARVGVEWLAA
ncbi:MAG: phosphotransferase, partial [Thermoleophilia bacterium]|nr:phosphotransferase [Thermoleophilia bacterium]